MFRRFFILMTLLYTGYAGVAFGDDETWRLEAGWESYAQGSAHDVRSSLLNPGNIIGLPSERVGVDLRPEFSASLTDTFKTVARPRARLFYEQGAGVTDSSFTKFHFDEASLRWYAANNLELLAGIHYVQWGPAELFSPSNPLIHFSLEQRSITFRMRGNALVEADYYFNAKTFLSLIAEPISNGEPDWIAGHTFTPRGLVRLERQVGDNPGNYVGATAGRMERGQLFASAYAATYVAELWSMYVDGRLSPGTPTIYPSLTSPNFKSPGQVNGGAWNGLATIGVRYEGYFDTRVEYILNTYGFNDTEWANTLALARANPLLATVAYGAGTELARQHYLYASARTDRLGTGDTWHLGFRYLHSLGDHSGSLFSSLEWNFNSYCTAILEPMITHGAPDGEFSQLTKWDLFASLRVAL